VQGDAVGSRAELEGLLENILDVAPGERMLERQRLRA
jgi:hypothetical protein